MARLSWDALFLKIAADMAQRSTCPRASVGAVVVRDNQVLGVGYNGAPSGAPHCEDVGCLIHNNHCIKAIHAELNAILQGMMLNSVKQSTLYCTHSPCWDCAKVLINVGIERVVFRDVYVDDRMDTLSFLSERGIDTLQLT